MQLPSVSTAVVLMYTAPVIVMIVSVAFLGEKMTPLKGICVVAMMVGCSLVSGIVGGAKFHAVGIAIGLLSGISYSAYNIFTKLQMRAHSHPMAATLYSFLFMAILACCFCKPGEAIHLIAANPVKTLPLVVSIGVVNCVLPYCFYTLALKELPVGTASALGIVEPMAATIFSVTLLGEKLRISSLLGIVLILGAVCLLSRNKE